MSVPADGRCHQKPMQRQTVFRSLVVAGMLFVTTSARGADDPMACVKELAMPSLRGLIHAFPATVVVHIAIGKGGTAKEVDYIGARPGLFRLGLDEYFKEKTRYAETCDGKTITFTIRYLVEGQKTGHPVWEVRFKPPDEIIVITHPMDPGDDPIRTTRPKSK